MMKTQVNRDKIEAQLKAEKGLFFSNDELEQRYKSEVWSLAVNWLMIPLTRSIDHLIIHLNSAESQLGKILSAVSDRNPGAIEWLDSSFPEYAAVSP